MPHDAARDHRHQRGPAKRLEPVRVGTAKAQRQAQHAVVDPGRRAAGERAPVVRAAHRLRTNDEVDRPGPQQRERPPVKPEVAQIDLLTQHELTARPLDALAQRGPVVGRSAREGAHLRVHARQPGRDLAGTIAAAVLGQHDLVGGEAHVGEAADQLRDRVGEDRLLVVYGDDDTELDHDLSSRTCPSAQAAASRPAIMQSSIAL